MSPDVPAGARTLLDFIAVHESGSRYDVIFGDHQNTLSAPLTSMTIEHLLSAQILWGRRWGSSAAGRYQIVQTTLAGLLRAGICRPTDTFSPNVQDDLGYALLKQRGYADFMARKMPLQTFALHLAQEWASLPVLIPIKGAHRMLAIGDSYYRGDGLNSALVSAASFEGALTVAHAAAS